MKNNITQRHIEPAVRDTEFFIKNTATFSISILFTSVPLCLCVRYLAVTFIVAFVALFSSCSSNKPLEDAPIITSASHQHTLYNGRGQPIEALTSKKNTPPPVITYFRSEADLHADRNGSQDAPVEVGNYFVRIRRPAGNGYRAGSDVTVEYHIQKALVTITAEARQNFVYDGTPKAVVFSVDQNVEPGVAYYANGSSSALGRAPTERGLYQAIISFAGDAHYMGSSKTVELVITNP